MSCNFSLEHYEEILKKIKKYNFDSTFLGASATKKKQIILRHDIDVCLESALKMANLEYEYNIQTTYFIWLQSSFYNMFSSSSIKMIENILEMGHAIGLHLECVYIENLSYQIANQINIIKKIFDYDITAISFHKPKQELISHGNIGLDGIFSAYSHEYINSFFYISDSRGKWRNNCLCRLIDEHIDRIHALIHPIWWDDNNNCKQKYVNSLVEQISFQWKQQIEE